jgi:hypothetical protein
MVMKPPPARLLFLFPVLIMSAIGAEKPAAAAPPARSAEESATAGSGWLGSLLFRPFDPNPDMEMTVITEMTDEGRKRPAVSREHPAYYQAHSSGDREMGERVNHEQTLPPEEVEPLLTRGLAVNGYQPAQLPEHPPSLLVVYLWGTHNKIGTDNADETTFQQVFSNVADRAMLVGGKKFAKDVTDLIREIQTLKEAKQFQMIPFAIQTFKGRSPNNEQLFNLALDDVFYVVASAFDYPSVAQGHPVLLWRTRMTVMAQGVQMKKAVPAVVASAGKYFGREMTEPALLHHSDIPEGKVELGTATVVKTPPESSATDQK